MIRRRRNQLDQANSSSYKNVVLVVLVIYAVYIIFLSSSFSLAPSHHRYHHQKQHSQNTHSTTHQLEEQEEQEPKNIASVRACIYSPYFDPVFHAYVVSSKGDIITPLSIHRSVRTSTQTPKWTLASSSTSRTIPSPILKRDAIVRSKNKTTIYYEISIDIRFEPVSMSQEHVVKVFIPYSSMAESLRDYPYSNAMTLNELLRSDPSKHSPSAHYLGSDTGRYFQTCDSTTSLLESGLLESQRRVFSFMWHPLQKSSSSSQDDESTTPLNYCVSSHEITNQGYWSGDSGQWHSRTCRIKRRSPAATRKCLRRVSLTFVGDSIVGQVSEFLRSGLVSCADDNELLRCDDPIWPESAPDYKSYVEMCRKNRKNPCLVHSSEGVAPYVFSLSLSLFLFLPPSHKEQCT